MGFLKKIVKKVKKGVSKVFKGVKKIAKKISKSKVLKTIALVGAALVTGGATAAAFGGQFSQSAIGRALIGAKTKIMSALGPVKFLAKPFEFAGTMIGTGAGKVSDFIGFTTEAGRANIGAGIDPFTLTDSGQMVDLGALETAEQTAGIPIIGETVQVAEETGRFAKGTVLGDVIRGTTISAGTGAILQSLQPDPEEIGVVAGRVSDEQGVNLNPLGISRFVSEVDLSDIYPSMYFGTADASYNMAGQNLYQQPTLGVLPS
tara:strand:- start:758 stop:1540 length:783 start_codon:yes stop_codon:yes gene_type:complete